MAESQTEAFKRQGHHRSMVNRIIGGRGCYKRFVMNRTAVAAVYSGRSIAICLAEGVIGLKPFGDYVEISFSKYKQ